MVALKINMDMGRLLDKKRNEILAITSKYGAYNVRLFGSVARREADQMSDVDFLVQLEPRCRLVDWLHLQNELEHLLGRKVDVIQEEALNSRARTRVLQDALPL